MSSTLEGQLLDGKYLVTQRIAVGGMSTVYLAQNQRIGKDVAVKVLHPIVAQDKGNVERFEREARIVSKIRSEHIADVFDFGELPSGERFMVMEYLEGESLAARIEREGTVAPSVLVPIALQMLEALGAAHAAGVVHRDLKPENVIVTTRGKEMIAKVVDFGISKYPGTDAEAKLTAANSVLGTPLYMSPEQARGNTAAIDHRTDLYSLGVILYEAIAGEPPLTGDNVNDLLFRVVLEEPPPLVKRVPSVDRKLAAIVQKAMAKKPEDRYQNAEEMSEALTAWLGRKKDDNNKEVSARDDNALPEADGVGTPLSLTVPAENERLIDTLVRKPKRAWKTKLGGLAAAACIGLLAWAGRQSLHHGRGHMASSTPPPVAASIAIHNDAPTATPPPAPVDAAVVETPHVEPPRVKTPIVVAPPAAVAAAVTTSRATTISRPPPTPRSSPPKAKTNPNAEGDAGAPMVLVTAPGPSDEATPPAE